MVFRLWFFKFAVSVLVLTCGSLNASAQSLDFPKLSGVKNGAWVEEHNGYGGVGVGKLKNGTKILYQSPQPSKSSGETHSSLVLSKSEFKTSKIRLRSRVVKQLRTPKPNPWETAWLLWNYKNNHRFYYFNLKTEGWELGKVDNRKKDPKGPSCLWPEYLNCFYPGAQRFLKTGSWPRTKVGVWDKVTVSQEVNVISVYVAGKRVVKYRDFIDPYYSGRVGLYSEDAFVQFKGAEVNGFKLDLD